jgi:2-polyprenyl-6-methoxyphenol hydroxylase-like FAD-dependent oxidoreductase
MTVHLGATRSSETNPDVVVVGARAAGAATALLLARLGHRVVVVDRAALPSDTVSTHQVSRTGVVALRRWGLLDEVLASGAPALRQVTFTDPGGSITRQVKARFGVDHLVAPRRIVLDAILLRAAVRAGAVVLTGLTVDAVRVDRTGRAVGIAGRDRTGAPVDLPARVVVGADGVNSRVARSVGAALVDDRGPGGATRYAYYAGLPWSGVEFVTADRAFTGVFPTNGGEACVWLCCPETDARAGRGGPGSDPTAAFEAHLGRAAPALAARLRRARRTSPVRGRLQSPNVRYRAFGAGWALVGDAGFHRDAVSAHGLSDAFRDAELLAVALDRALRGEVDEADALAGYERQRDAALAEIFDLTCALSAYPAVPEFVDLMRRLGTAIDTEAAALAVRPVPGERPLALSTKESQR